MNDWLARDYSGPPLQFFGPAHLGALAAIGLAVAALWLTLRRGVSPQASAAIRWSIVALCLISQLGWDAWQLTVGIWRVSYSLPLHICTLSVLLSALMLATRSYLLYQLLYFWGWAGATQALITPDILFGFPHLAYWVFFISHASIYLALVYMTVTYQYRPTWRSLLLAFVAVNLLMIPVGLVNWLTGANYMFIARPPAAASLLDLLGPWPTYLLAVQPIALLVFVICYLPWLGRTKDERREIKAGQR
jgi:hypothetical integral membrane protein (TIGR02206 family)